MLFQVIQSFWLDLFELNTKEFLEMPEGFLRLFSQLLIASSLLAMINANSSSSFSYRFSYSFLSPFSMATTSSVTFLSIEFFLH